jgi:hypothetical protein
MIKAIGTTAAALLVAGALVPGAATAAPAAAAVNCALASASVTAGGDHRSQLVIATTPPTVRSPQLDGQGAFAPGQVRVSSSLATWDDGYDGYSVGGYLLIGDGLYYTGYHAVDGVIDTPAPHVTRVGGGWGSFVALEEAEYQSPTEAGVSRWNTYGLTSSGVLYRWTLDTKGVWRNKVSAPGFAAVKSMALISKSKTYDTFLANTRGGALYTIHIPTSSPMKPIVKQVRAKTWQGFETLLTQKCGQYGTIVLGIDRDTDTAYLYAASRFNGTSTVIQLLGKVPATFADNLYFRFKDRGAQLNGE